MIETQSASWVFQNPVRVHFGAGTRSALAPLVAGKRILAVATRRGKAQFLADPVLRALNADLVWVDTIQPNPGLADVQAEINRLEGQPFDAVVAFGGGSAMDAAKALAAALTPGLETRDLQRLIAEPHVFLDRPLLAIHALSTTSGTGAEVTPFATIWDHGARRKLSLTSPRLFPKTAIVDPELTYDLPHAATMSTGMDAMNQAFESVWNRNRTPLTTLLASRAIGLSLTALPALAADLGDHSARAAIAEASLLAGLCISQTRTAICHAMSYPLTAHFGIDHGLACAATMEAVAQRVLAEAPDGLADVARILGLPSPEALVARMESALQASGLPAILSPNLPDFDTVLELHIQMVTPGRSDNFPLPMDYDGIADILRTSALNPQT